MIRVNLNTLPSRKLGQQLGCGNGTIERLRMKKKKAGTHPYNVEVVVGEGEPEERAISRFRRLVSQSGVVPEARRRMQFESNRDRKIRKLQEKFRKKKMKFQDEISTYEQTHSMIEPSPFQDLFEGDGLVGDSSSSDINELIAMASGMKTMHAQPQQDYTNKFYNNNNNPRNSQFSQQQNYAQRYSQYVPQDRQQYNQNGGQQNQQQQQQQQWYSEPEQQEWYAEPEIFQ